jgi:hypothetical protein
MSSRVEIYLSKADECEEHATAAMSPLIRDEYRNMAQQWRALASDAKAIERIQEQLKQVRSASDAPP